MKLIKEKKTNPKIRIGLLKADEERIIKELKEKEKEIQVKLEELKAIRKLLAEVINEIEEEEYEETLKKEIEEERNEKEISESIDQLVSNVKTELGKTNEQTLYTGLKSDTIAIAASENSISRLYELAYKNSSWTEEESKEFFNIKEAVNKVKSYDLSPNLSQVVENTYKAIQTVFDQKIDDIKQNYKPAYNVNIRENRPFENTSFEKIKMPEIKTNEFLKPSISENYKSPVFENKEQTKKILDKKNLELK